MSRAFVKEDSDDFRPGPTYRLPPRDAPGYLRAAAEALLEGARAGDTAGAEVATGYAWGAAELRGPVEALLAEAEKKRDDRLVQLAERFLGIE